MIGFAFNKISFSLHQKNTKVQQIWKIRKIEAKFQSWIYSLNRVCLFFYGASKKNLGKAGSGGLIILQDKARQISYNWGLGQISNNNAEAHGLLLGLKILRDRKINNAIIFGDSSLIIQAMVRKTPPKNATLNQILHREIFLAKHIEWLIIITFLEQITSKQTLKLMRGFREISVKSQLTELHLIFLSHDDFFYFSD